MIHLQNLRALSCSRNVRRLGLPLASTAAAIALTSFSAPAKALSFNWQFNNTDGNPTSTGVVTGTISGLLDNTSGQTTGLTITVTSAPNTPSGGWSNAWTYFEGSGFTVSSGQVTASDVWYKAGAQNLFFGDLTGDYYPQLIDSVTGDDNSAPSGATTFTPQAAAVPGPLPILGAASALGWSRRVRSRLRNAQPSAR